MQWLASGMSEAQASRESVSQEAQSVWQRESGEPDRSRVLEE